MVTFTGFTTLDQLETYYYGGQYNQEFNKAQGGISTDTTGTYNSIYGAMVWANFNLEANLFGAIPKYPWTRSGWRILTDKADDVRINSTSTGLGLGGTTQGGAIADPQHPDYQEITTLPKTLQYVIQATDVTENLVGKTVDDVTGSLSYQRVYAADQIKELFNRQLLQDPLDTKITNDATDLESRKNMESINRIISSKAEYDSVVSPASTSIFNPWRQTASITRNTATTWDSTVVSPSGTLGSSDVLTNDLFTRTFAALRTASGKEPTMLVGGQDTYSEIQNLYINAYRIENSATMRGVYSVGVNGISTFTGTNIGFNVSTVYGYPYIPTKDSTPGRGTNDAGNIYLLNTSASKYDPTRPLLGTMVLKPVLYYEASERQPIWPFSNDSFTDRAVYQALMDTVCTNFKAQGKIVDIKRGS